MKSGDNVKIVGGAGYGQGYLELIGHYGTFIEYCRPVTDLDDTISVSVMYQGRPNRFWYRLKNIQTKEQNILNILNKIK